MNEISHELLRIAKSVLSENRIAGVIEVPPAMSSEIEAWIAGMVAVNAYLEAKDYRNHLLVTMEMFKNSGSDQSLNDAKKMFEKNEQKIKDSYELAKTVKVSKKWSRASKKFGANFSGSRYESVLRKALPEKLKEANDKYGIVTVKITEQVSGNAAAYWSPSESAIAISTGLFGNWRSYLTHELTHFVQAYLSLALDTEFGRPSGDMRNVGLSQRPTKEYKQQHRDINDFHSLDDVEFYPEIGSLIDTYERYKKNHDKSQWKNLILGLLGVKVVSITDAASFMKTLKAKNRQKWQKVVKEVLKKVMP